MFSLAWALARAGGWGRAVLLAGCTAVVSALLMVAVTIARLEGDVQEQLASFVRDDGTRGGAVFAMVLLTVPPLLLLDQGVRLGSVHRERRLAALHVAGATPAEIRRLGAIEVGVPAAAGAVAGLGVFAVLRSLLGAREYSPGPFLTSSYAVVPSSVSPTLWQLALVVVLVAASGTLVGWRGTPAAVSSPWAVSRRATRARPRPWGLVTLLAAVVVAPIGLGSSALAGAVVILVVGLLVLTPILIAPWLADVMARRVVDRTERATSILAAQRIVAAPGPAGRAAAAIGGIALVGGGLAGFVLDVATTTGVGDASTTAATVMVGTALLVGLLVAAGSLAVHSVELMQQRRRQASFLAATGVSEAELESVTRQEITLVALPLAIVGSFLGALPVPLISGNIALVVPAVALGVGASVALVWGASTLAVRAVRPWARRATSPLNLRTE
jgi:hypothetical protein